MNNYEINFPLSDVPSKVVDGFLQFPQPDGTSLSLPEFDKQYGIFVNLGICDNGRENRFIFCAEGKCGFAEITTGRVITEPVWDWVSQYACWYATVNIGCETPTESQLAYEDGVWSGKYGIIDYEGKIKIPAIYDNIYRKGCDGAIVQANEKYGYFLVSGEIILPIKYDRIDVLYHRCYVKNGGKAEDQIIIAELDGQVGAFDAKGSELLPFKFAQITATDKDCFICEGHDGKLSFLARNQTIFSDAEALAICYSEDCNKKYIIAQKQEKFALYRVDGKMLTDFTMTLAQIKRIMLRILPDVYVHTIQTREDILDGITFFDNLAMKWDNSSDKSYLVLDGSGDLLLSF